MTTNQLPPAADRIKIMKQVCQWNVSRAADSPKLVNDVDYHLGLLKRAREENIVAIDDELLDAAFGLLDEVKRVRDGGTSTLLLETTTKQIDAKAEAILMNPLPVNENVLGFIYTLLAEFARLTTTTR